MDLSGGPASDHIAAVEQPLEQTDDAGVVDLDAEVTNRSNRDGQRQALEQREVDVNLEALGLEAGETVGNGLESSADAGR